MATWRNDFPSLLWTLSITPAVSVLTARNHLESCVLSGKAWPGLRTWCCTRISYLTQCVLCRIWSHGTKNTLLDGKQRNGSLKRKDISFLKDVTALFSVLPSFAIQQDAISTVWSYSAKGFFSKEIDSYKTLPTTIPVLNITCGILHFEKSSCQRNSFDRH